MWALCVLISEPEIKNAFWYNFFMWILNTLVAIESSYFSVCQHVPVQISNLSASVVALTAFVRHLPHVRPHLYLKTWCVYAREVLVTFVCLFTSMCHLVFLQLMYILVCKSYHIGQTLSNTLRLLASVRHFVNLQCIRESGSEIVLFAAMWLFSYMLPHHVLS